MYETMGEELLGDDVLGDEDDMTVGAIRRLPRRGRLALPRRPQWRSRVAPGVPGPMIGLQPLPLTPSVNNGVFNATTHEISFTARPQSPFRSERLLASVRRTGAAGTIILANNFFVGRDLQLVELGTFDIEFFGPTAFGVRLKLAQAEPGQLIRIDLTDNPDVGGTDTVAVSLLLLGHSIT